MRSFPSLAAVLGLAVVAGPIAAAEDVDFLREVRPILVGRCFRCHSEVLEHEAGLKLDKFATLMKGGDDGAVIVAGKSGESKLIQRITATDDMKMPPEGQPLTAEQIAKIKAWIDQGAKGPPEGAEEKPDHWSFQKPVRPTVPTPANAAYVRNPIDAFIAAKHEEMKLTPVAAAPRHVLLRRIYLDLIGLPPTPEQLQAFLNDTSSDAYERVVDELLKSPHYGERWGRHWMDVWRYSDWDGYGKEVRESKPHIWRWRDWIIESLNDDKPYDRMVEEMLAGDELAPDDPNTLRATGFLVRNWYKFNRNVWLDNTVEHTGKAFLGVTFNCARCHSHMYDPITHEEYYQLRAIFEPYDVRTDRLPGEANVEKDGLVRAFDAKADTPTYLFSRGNEKDPVKDKPLAPRIAKLFAQVAFKVEPVSLTPAAYYQGVQPFVQEETLAAARKDAEAAKTAFDAAQKKVAEAKQRQADFVAAASKPTDPESKKPEPLIADDFSRQRDDLWTIGLGNWEYKDGKLTQSDTRDEMCGLTSVQPHPKDFVAKLRWKTTGGDTYKSVGIAFDAVEKDLLAVYLSHASPGPHLWQKKGGADSYPASMPKNTAVELGREYDMQIAVRGALLNVWIDGQFVLAYKLPEPRPENGKLVLWTYDATAEFLQASLEALPSDLAVVEPGGKAAPAAMVTAESLALAISDTEKEAAIAEKTLAAAQLHVATVEARIAADQANYASPPAANAKDLALAAGKLERELAVVNAEKALLAAALKVEQTKRAVKAGDMATEKAAKDAEAALDAAKKANEAAVAAVGQENENYTRLTPVHPATSTGRRLALAKFITSKDNPLTARVAINHLWLRHFGSPLVPSVFDFGMNGKSPTNQALLDWLAVELMESGWSMKHIHRLMVMSKTYRLASSASGGRQSPKGQESGARSQEPGARSQEPGRSNAQIDSENKYYWRANPRRLEAEIVRDATLFVAGSLDPAMGGPEIDQNAGLTNGRRSVYFRSTKEKKMTFLSLFDSANVVECYRRSESIAPQQALAMANSPLTLAQSRLLAKKLSDSLGNVAAEEGPKQFVEGAFVRILCREPSGEELQACLEFLAEQSQRLSDASSLSAFTAGAAALVPPSSDPAQRARENLVHVLMNHNDFVTVR
ncbi:MAG TPA: DUF1549 domain-containing protein [Pirellulaceae bacterium]|nr:DUF1549 domain-containing protein [Pirellulaceae bacterium]